MNEAIYHNSIDYARKHVESKLNRTIDNDELRSVLADSKNCLLPLFHGTLRHVLLMSKEDRLHTHKMCEVALDLLVRVYGENHISNANLAPWEVYKMQVIPPEQKRWDGVYASAKSAVNGDWKYDVTYMTWSPRQAYNYASDQIILGEIGRLAYLMYQGVMELGYRLPVLTSDQENALAYIDSYNPSNDIPVVLMFTDIEKSTIVSGRNEVIDWDKEIDLAMEGYGFGEVRLLSEINFSKGREVRMVKECVRDGSKNDFVLV